MKALKKRFFNMVELAIAIAVVAIGLTSVLSLVPVSIKTGSTANTNYYTSDISDSVNAFIMRKFAAVDDELAESGWTATITELPKSKPLPELNGSESWTATGEGCIYSVENTGNGVYGIKMTSGDMEDITDIIGEVLIWRNRVGNSTIGKNEPVDIKLNALAGINVEVSVPLSKPYSQRKKYNYYFEVFNQDARIRCLQEEEFEELVQENSEETAPFIRNGGELIATEDVKIRIKVLASELLSGSMHVPVYVRACINEPGNDSPEGRIYENCFTNDKFLYNVTPDLLSDENKNDCPHTMETAALPGNTWEIDVPEGSSYKIWAGFYFNIWYWTFSRYSYHGSDVGIIVNSHWSTNENQVITSVDGDNPPEFSSDGLNLKPEECIESYINENGLVTLKNNQILHLFELSHTNRSGSGFDMQDMIIMAELIEN
ncbi:MAG: hypothetical protein K9L78_03325 [Victivallales bacterium]|nr:hypothetical protein [Victivallales bacterium]MCF7889130.1 hypothetical protein [Victivallales bacterium]